MAVVRRLGLPLPAGADPPVEMIMTFSRGLLASSALCALVLACGGDDSPSAPGTPSSPDPSAVPVLTTLTVGLSASSVAEGQSVTATAAGADQNGAAFALGAITWTSSDESVARVDGSGGVSTLERGQTAITATVGSVSGQASLSVTPAPIANIDESSSYRIAQVNARASMLDWRSFPEDGPMKTARGVADLDGDGVPDVFLAAGIFLEESPTIPVRFFKGAGDGTSFSDVTASWLVGSAPGLLSARKVTLADINGDGVPDPFVCAHGYDADPFPGTTNLLLMSGGGRWSVAAQSWTDRVGFYHGCAAGDVDNDGDVDMLVLDANAPSYLLLNDGLGTLVLDRAGLPASMQGRALVFSTEFVDVDADGFIDLMVGGDEVYQPTVVFWGDGTGRYDEGRASVVPGMPGWTNVTILAAEDLDGDGVNEVVVGRAKGAYGDPDFYMGYRVQVATMSGRSFTDATDARAAPANGSAASVLLDYKNDPKWIEWMWVSDYDGDGLPDLIGSDGYTGSYLARNRGGSFGTWEKR